MTSASRSTSSALILLAIPAFLVASLTGCGSSSAPKLTAAKNMYVIQSGQNGGNEADNVLVFPATSTGASTPVSTLSLPSGVRALSVATSPSGQIYVGAQLTEGTGEILVFAPGATGAATPTATYASASGSFDIPVFLAINSAGQLFVEGNNQTFEVFAADADPAAPPAQYITTYVSNSFSYGIGADAAGNMYVDDLANEAIDVFAAGATGNATPARIITGTGGQPFGVLYDITADDAGNITALNYSSQDDPFNDAAFRHAKARFPNDSGARFLKAALAKRFTNSVVVASTGIYTFGIAATGNATPTSTISGSTTTVNEPNSIAVDALDNMYYVDSEGGSATIMSFKAGATGNVAPTTSMTSTSYQGESYLNEIAVY
jgi:hypothetical protein